MENVAWDHLPLTSAGFAFGLPSRHVIYSLYGLKIKRSINVGALVSQGQSALDGATE
jgi:hypothetical protein